MAKVRVTLKPGHPYGWMNARLNSGEVVKVTEQGIEIDADDVHPSMEVHKQFKFSQASGDGKNEKNGIAQEEVSDGADQADQADEVDLWPVGGPQGDGELTDDDEKPAPEPKAEPKKRPAPKAAPKSAPAPGKKAAPKSGKTVKVAPATKKKTARK